MNNSLAEVHPELVSEWSKKNKIKSTEVSIGSHKKVIWRCVHDCKQSFWITGLLCKKFQEAK